MGKKASKQPPPPEKIDLFFTDTFPYEVSMMRATYSLLDQSIFRSIISCDKDLYDVLKNSLVESFCVHARNLIDFFRGRRDPDFKLQLFTNANYSPAPGSFLNTKLVDKLDDQISHISSDRPFEASNKIGDADRHAIIVAVEAEIVRFGKNLSDEFREKWKVTEYRVPVASQLDLSTTMIANATSQIRFDMLKIGPWPASTSR